MSAYTWAGFYPAQFNTPLGSAIVAPGRVVEWPDGPPNEGHGWVDTPDVEPTPFEELGTQEETEPDGEETTPADSTAVPAEPASTPTDTPTDEPSPDTTSPQATDHGESGTTDQPEPATKRSTRANK